MHLVAELDQLGHDQLLVVRMVDTDEGGLVAEVEEIAVVLDVHLYA